MRLAEPATYRWTRTEFQQMKELGWFIDKRVELIDGEVVEMPVPGIEHCKATDRVAEALRKIFVPGHWVMVQMPLNLNPYSELLPDVGVVRGARDDYQELPQTAVLIVEVSDSTLTYDRNRNGSLYARKNILDYWIVNLGDRQLEVLRNSIPDAEQLYGFRYGSVTILKSTEQVAPLAMPNARISVADLLP